MAMERFDDDLKIIAGLGDDPKRDDGLSTQGFKSIFDKAGLLIQDFINNKLIPYIEKQNVGLPLGGGTMEGPINMNGQKMTGLNAPTEDSEAANKGYVDQHTNPPLPGVIYPYSGANIPDGFLLCDGAAYSRTEYAELFAAIGTMYGSGDGSTTFNVPDLVERVPAGAGDNHPAGKMVGEETHILTMDEMPEHNHGSETATTTGTIGYADGSGTKSSFTVSYGTISSRTDLDIRVALNGGSHPHNIMQPTTFIRGYIIATGKGSGVSVQDIIAGVQALPLGIEYGGMGATDAKTARDNLGITPDNIGALSMELLWENASPASGMNAQDITLDTDAELYLVEYYTHSTTYSDFKFVKNGKTNRINFYGNASSSGLHSELIVRDITITGGKLSLSDATNKEMGATSVTTVNHYLRPFRVFAVKGVST